MDVMEKTAQAGAELITPEEFINRLGIKKSTLYLWKSKGWLTPRRHFIKIGSRVMYFWSNELLIEIHDICNRESKPQKVEHEAPALPTVKDGQRVDWDY